MSHQAFIEMTDRKLIDTLEQYSPYILTSMFSMAVAFGMALGLQRGLNIQARDACTNNNYAKLISFRSAAGEAAVCLPAYVVNGSKSLRD